MIKIDEELPVFFMLYEDEDALNMHKLGFISNDASTPEIVIRLESCPFYQLPHAVNNLLIRELPDNSFERQLKHIIKMRPDYKELVVDIGMEIGIVIE